MVAQGSVLCLHAGAKPVSYDELGGMEAPPASGRFMPIAHKVLVDQAVTGLNRFGFSVKRMQFGVANGIHGEPQGRFFGTLDLESTLSEGVGLAMGLRNSFDKTMRAGIAAGDRVFCCDNLAFVGDIVVMRKHTTFILRDLENKINSAFSQLPQFVDQRTEQIKLMREKKITDVLANDFLLRATYDRDVIGRNELSKVLDEWRKKENSDIFGDHTVWNLYNSITEVKKDRFGRHGHNAAKAAAETIDLNSMITSELLTVVN